MHALSFIFLIVARILLNPALGHQAIHHGHEAVHAPNLTKRTAPEPLWRSSLAPSASRRSDNSQGSSGAWPLGSAPSTEMVPLRRQEANIRPVGVDPQFRARLLGPTTLLRPSTTEPTEIQRPSRRQRRLQRIERRKGLFLCALGLIGCSGSGFLIGMVENAMRRELPPGMTALQHQHERHQEMQRLVHLRSADDRMRSAQQRGHGYNVEQSGVPVPSVDSGRSGSTSQRMESAILKASDVGKGAWTRHDEAERRSTEHVQSQAERERQYIVAEQSRITYDRLQEHRTGTADNRVALERQRIVRG